MTKQIQMIRVEEIFEHPDNPRRNVGDVTELADSIRESGILQNLTVVPHEGAYRVIIGHRRLAAAKKAGLKEVPCVISDMDYKTQLATMLSENMQRADLNIVEQSYGIQQLFDLGVDMDEVKQKTGFSESTIKKRVKIASLPKKGADEALARGATIEEYLKCCEIEDEKERNTVLSKAGTNDFSWAHTQAIRKQEIKKFYPDVIKKVLHHHMKKLDSFERWRSDVEKVCGGYIYNEKDRNELLNFVPGPRTEYAFYSDKDRGEIYIYKRVKKKKSDKPSKSAKEIEADRRRNELKKLSEDFFEIRCKFVLSLQLTKEIEKEAWNSLLIFTTKKALCYYDCRESILKMGSGDKSPDVYANSEAVLAWLAKDKKAVLVMAYYFSGDGKCNSYSGNRGETMPTHTKSIRLNEVYAFLEKLGYKISTEEQQLLDGTHELFKPYEEEKK